MAAAESAIRLETPHSLSYQATTRMKLPPSTFVWSMAKVAECGSWLRSEETSGSFVQVMIGDRRLDFAAVMIAALTSSTVAFFLDENLKSISDTLGVGTRIEAPSSLPASSGSTRPIALAAPVEVGMMFTAAARAR